MSDENLPQEMLDTLRTPDGRRRFLFELRTLPPAGAVVGAGAVALFAVGQIIALGLGPAWRAYWPYWVGAPLLGVGALLALVFLSVAIGLSLLGVFKTLTFLVRNTLGRLYPKAKSFTFTGRHLTGLVTLALLASFLIGSSFSEARKRLPKIEGMGASALAEATASLEQQKKATSKLSSTAKDLIGGLDQTLLQVEQARRDLASTLAAVDAQRAATERTGEQLRDLDQQREAIDRTTDELRRHLGGKDPITKEDLDRSGWIGLAWGAVLGLFGSLAASALYEKLKLRLSRSPEGPRTP